MEVKSKVQPGAGLTQPVAPDRDESEGPRKILLFSDGTGNSSSAADKTNVWRLYEALDLGYPLQQGSDKQVQLAYYDNGVGTSTFKLFAVLGGIFGFGLARNIRDIYKFLCRNYQPGDSIYAFGFSRGAYTIRLLVALVAAVGLVPYRDERQLDFAARDMWREYRRDFHANNWIADFLVGLGRWLVRNFIRIKRCVLMQPAFAADLPEKRKRPFWVQEWWDHTCEKLQVIFGDPVENRIREGLPQVGPDIEFVGVWDTVAAYGGPVIELTRAIDEWIWPLTMPDYRLSTKVRVARHALAIDDKRDSFSPLLWDEVNESELKKLHVERLGKLAAELDGDLPGELAFAYVRTTDILEKLARGRFPKRKLWFEKQQQKIAELLPELPGKKAAAYIRQADILERFRRTCKDVAPVTKSPRLQQVWFAGMHSDVGGGYDDDSLAYVSLWWMIEHAEAAGLRLLPESRRRIERYRNIYGPIHDSRGGGGAFYRYQPRYISAWLDYKLLAEPEKLGNPAWRKWSHVMPTTQIFRDQTIDHGLYRTRGLMIAPISLHLSVEERLRMATDGYAPINIPMDYRVDDGIRGPSPSDYPLRSEAQRKGDQNILHALSDNIKLRRVFYFCAFWSCIVLALKPQWPSIPILDGLPSAVDVRTDAAFIEQSLNAVVPGFLSNWVHAVSADLFNSLLVVGAIGVFTALGVGREKAMTDLSRSLWRARFDAQLPAVSRSWSRIARWLHAENWLQWALAKLKWRIVPFFLGAALLIAILFAVQALTTQIWLARVESRPSTCRIDDAFAEVTGADGPDTSISANETCHDLDLLVKPDTAYRIEIEMEPSAEAATATQFQGGKEASYWADASQVSTPLGWRNPDSASFKIPLFGWQLDTHVSVHALSKFNRRVMSAPLMAPVLELRSRTPSAVRQALLGEPIHMLVPQFRLRETIEEGDGNPVKRRIWEGTFRTPEVTPRLYRETASGMAPQGIRKAEERARLFVFLNDAVFPFDGAARGKPGCSRFALGIDFFNLCGRYQNNTGSYRLHIAEERRSPIDQSIDDRIATVPNPPLENAIDRVIGVKPPR